MLKKINRIVGKLLVEPKYRFIQEGLMGEIVRDVFEKLEEDE